MLIRLWRSCAAQEAAQKIQKYTRVLERGHVPKARKDMQLRARYRSRRAMDVKSAVSELGFVRIAAWFRGSAYRRWPNRPPEATAPQSKCVAACLEVGVLLVSKASFPALSSTNPRWQLVELADLSSWLRTAGLIGCHAWIKLLNSEILICLKGQFRHKKYVYPDDRSQFLETPTGALSREHRFARQISGSELSTDR
jgi:hypothetical protein